MFGCVPTFPRLAVRSVARAGKPSRNVKIGLRPIAQPYFSSSVFSSGWPCKRTLTRPRDDALRANSLLASGVVPASAGWSQLPRTLVRGCPVNLPYSPEYAITSHGNLLRPVLLSIDLPTHDPFRIDQAPVDRWVVHCSLL